MLLRFLQKRAVFGNRKRVLGRKEARVTENIRATLGRHLLDRLRLRNAGALLRVGKREPPVTDQCRAG